MTIRRVALVSEHASPLAVLGGADAGGQNVHVAALATELGRLGVDVVVHTRRDDPDLPAMVRLAPNVRVEHVDAGPPRPIPKDHLLPLMDDFAAELHRRWWLEPPDVVHAHFWMSGYASTTAARPLQVPVLQTFHALGAVKRRHQGHADGSPGERLAIEAALVGDVDRIVATCRDEVRELRAIARPRAVSVIPCGVDTDLFTPTGPTAARSSRPSFRLVSVGRLVERKGVGDVIRALVELPDTELVIAGGPAARDLDADDEVQRLRALARAARVDDRVAFLGRQTHEDVPRLLRSADVVVCVPWYEPFGIVPLEAMACGVPVVASAVGGLLDTVVDGVTGWHVRPRRPDQVARTVRRALSDARHRRRLGAAGARRVRKWYRWSAVARATLAAYEETVDRAPAARPARAAGAIR